MKLGRMHRSLCWIALLVGIGAPPAGAGDGRLEINQACVATGCFPGDAPGFPIETQAGRSYVLTSSLGVPNVNTRGVTLASRSVLDLNGFEIAGPTTCTGAPAVCSAPGSGVGVYAEDHSTIRNGTIRGMGSYGIAGEVGVTIEQMLIQANASVGIYLNYGSDGPEAHLIRASRVIGNGAHGILNTGATGGFGSQITDCVIHGNNDYGLFVSSTLVTNNSVSRNGMQGLYGTDTAAAQNTFIENNGGNANPQIVGDVSEIGDNFCGDDAVCP
jgi:hypothetical protein